MKKKIIHSLAIFMLPVFLLASITWIKREHVCEGHCSMDALTDNCCSDEASLAVAQDCCSAKALENTAHCNKIDNCCFDETLVLDANMGDFEKLESNTRFLFIPDFLLLKISTKGAKLLQGKVPKTPQSPKQNKAAPKTNLLFSCFRC